MTNVNIKIMCFRKKQDTYMTISSKDSGKCLPILHLRTAKLQHQVFEYFYFHSTNIIIELVNIESSMS